jgi:hypothetical protein
MHDLTHILRVLKMTWIIVGLALLERLGSLNGYTSGWRIESSITLKNEIRAH